MSIPHNSTHPQKTYNSFQLQQQLKEEKTSLLVAALISSLVAVSGIFFVLAAHQILPSGVNAISSLGSGGFAIGYTALSTGLLLSIAIFVKRAHVGRTENLILQAQNHLSEGDTEKADATFEYIARMGKEKEFLSSPLVNEKMINRFAPHEIRIIEHLDSAQKTKKVDPFVVFTLSLIEKTPLTTEESIKKALELYSLALHSSSEDSLDLKIYNHFKTHFLPLIQKANFSLDRLASLLLTFALKEHAAKRFDNANDCFSHVGKNFPSILTSHHRIIWAIGLISLNKQEKAEELLVDLNPHDKALNPKECFYVYNKLGDYLFKKAAHSPTDLQKAVRLYKIAATFVENDDFQEFRKK